MAYNATHKETLEYRNNDILINKARKQIKQMAKELIKIENNFKEAFPKEFYKYFPNTVDKILDKMQELIGTKRYKGEEIPLSMQYEMYKNIMRFLRKFKYQEQKNERISTNTRIHDTNIDM